MARRSHDDGDAEYDERQAPCRFILFQRHLGIFLGSVIDLFHPSSVGCGIKVLKAKKKKSRKASPWGVLIIVS